MEKFAEVTSKARDELAKARDKAVGVFTFFRRNAEASYAAAELNALRKEVEGVRAAIKEYMAKADETKMATIEAQLKRMEELLKKIKEGKIYQDINSPEWMEFTLRKMAVNVFVGKGSVDECFENAKPFIKAAEYAQKHPNSMTRNEESELKAGQRAFQEWTGVSWRGGQVLAKIDEEMR